MVMKEEQSVSNQQIDYVFKQLKITGWPHVFVVTLTAIALWRYQPNLGIPVWFLVMQTSHFLRTRILDPLWQQLHAEQGDYFTLRVLLPLGMFWAGCMWAMIPMFYLQAPQSETFVFVTITLAGMISATLPALGAYLPAYMGFVLPIFVALSLRYYQVDMDAAALLTLAFMFATGGISFMINKIITRSITIDLRNQILLDEVTRAKERAEQANDAKSRFLAAASHDLRQPLQALGLMLESVRLRLGNGEEALRPLVNQCLESHDALSVLLNSLLELSRLESHEVQVHPIALQIRDLVGSIVAEFQPSAQQKGLYLDYAGGDSVVRTDPVLFGRVLRNLISNAIKFTREGNVTITFVRDGDEVVLSVIDTGIGIPPEEQDRVFDEYHQVANPARNREEGIGLGLSVVKKMCQLLGHPLKLVSEPGQGTTFSMRLPVGVLDTPPPRSEPVPPDLAGCRVLVVDDDHALLSAVSEIMDDWHCVSVMADSFAAALDHIRNGHFVPDIILSDYRLGEGANGIDLIEALQAELGQLVPAVLMSGDTDPALVKSIRERRYYLIHKPVKPIHLRKTMRNLLQA